MTDEQKTPSNNRAALQGGGMIAFGTLATRALGFAREILAAALFGTGVVYDAFLVAFSVPNLFRRVLGEEMLERAFLPPFRRLIAEGREAEAKSFLIKVFWIVTAALLVVTAGIWMLLPGIVHLLAPGLDSDAAAAALSMSRLILPFLFLIGVASLEGAILLFSGRKLLFALAPAVTNVAVVVVLLLLHSRLGVNAMVIAWLVGAAAAVVVQFPAVLRIFRTLPTLPAGKTKPPVAPAVREGGSILASSLVTKAVEVVDRAVASLIGAGAISSLYFAFRLVHLPFSILSLALSRSIAPELSRLRGENDSDGLGRLIAFGLEVNLVVLTPVVVFMMLFSDEVVALLYGYGRFGADSVASTSLAFFYYALAILPMGFIGLLNRSYSALEDNRLPLMAAGLGGAINIGLDLLLYRTHLAQGGIALASAIGLSVQALVMLLYLKRFGVIVPWRRFMLTGLRTVVSLVALVAVLVAYTEVIPAVTGVLGRAARLGGAAVLAMLAYVTVALILRPVSRPDRVRVMLTGGGTGGHVYPALAIHDILHRHQIVEEVLFVGVRGRAEEVIVPRHGLPIQFVSSAPYAGGSMAAKSRSLLTIARGVIESMLIMSRYRPQLLVATGGYVSAPVIIAAFLLKPFLRTRIVMEEQNLVPGALNKIASLLSDAVLVSFRESAYFIWSSRCVYSGYPVRRAYLEESTRDQESERQRLGLPEDAFVVLVTGGSMGARSINRAVVAALPELHQRIPKLCIVHSVGMMKGNGYDALEDTRQRLNITLTDHFDSAELTASDDGRLFYRAFEYLHDLIAYQRIADLIICRGGAGSLAEVLTLGKAALVVPKRGLPGDHQELNAIGIAEKGAVEVLFEARDPASNLDVVDPKVLADLVVELADDPERRSSLAEKSLALSFHDTEARVADTVRAVLEGQEPDLIAAIVEPPFVRFQRQFDSLIRYLDTTADAGLYRRLYEIKIDEYLTSANYLVVNRGIKLIGALKRKDLYPVLYRDFDRYKGFQKRNCLDALSKADEFEAVFVDLIEKGLGDGYYEVRREAVELYATFHRDIAALPRAGELQAAILAFVAKRRESFEVRAAAIRAAVLFLDEDAFLTTVTPFLFARNVRLREAILNAVEIGLAEERFDDLDHLRRFVKRMLITTSQFKPEFIVRERYVSVVQKLGG